MGEEVLGGVYICMWEGGGILLLIWVNTSALAGGSSYLMYMEEQAHVYMYSK